MFWVHIGFMVFMSFCWLITLYLFLVTMFERDRLLQENRLLQIKADKFDETYANDGELVRLFKENVEAADGELTW